MDDRLQRRLRDADPLAAAEGQLPDPARLDAIKEQLMLSATENTGGAPAGPTPRRGLMRPRAIGVTAVAAAGLAAVLVVGSLARPASSALAWDPSPTAATPAQEAAATEACQIPEPPAVAGREPTDGEPVPVTGSVSGTTGVVEGGGAVAGGGTTVITDGEVPEGAIEVTEGTITTSEGELPAIELPTELPPLAYLELHGTGAVAIFADDEVTAYCLLVAKGDGFELAGLQVPMTGGGAIGMAVGSTGVGAGVAMTGMAMAGRDGFDVSAMATDYGDARVGIIAGDAPDGSATVKVIGGPADGATATVDDGRFALWAPEALKASITLVALDASGAEIDRVELGAPPRDPARPETPRP
jgi:hypothetical protein